MEEKEHKIMLGTGYNYMSFTQEAEETINNLKGIIQTIAKSYSKELQKLTAENQRLLKLNEVCKKEKTALENEVKTLKSKHAKSEQTIASLEKELTKAEAYYQMNFPYVLEVLKDGKPTGEQHLIWEGTAAFKQAVQKAMEDAKEELGRSSIGLNTIAQAILKLPTFDMQYQTFQTVNTLLTGTVWTTKAKDVMDKIFIKAQQQRKTPAVEIGHATFIGSKMEVGTLNAQEVNDVHNNDNVYLNKDGSKG